MSCLALPCSIGTRLRYIFRLPSEQNASIVRGSQIGDCTTILKRDHSYYDNQQGDQRLPHDSGRGVELSTLERLGVMPRTHMTKPDVDSLAAERQYKCRDVINVSKQGENAKDLYSGWP